MAHYELSGKHALVAGGSRGIGLASARALAACGARVTLLARDPERLNAAVDGLSGEGHRAIPADASDVAAWGSTIERLLAEAGPVHILINNSGGPPPGAVRDTDWDRFPEVFAQHVGSAHTTTRLVLPGMREAGYGRVINIISTSVKQPIPGLGVSNTVRGAMANWAKTLAAEVARDGITVNNVLPGATRTERLEQLIAGKAAREKVGAETVAAAMEAGIPAGRFAAPEEVAQAVLFLASPEAAYITGVNLPVDGGRTASL